MNFIFKPSLTIITVVLFFVNISCSKESDNTENELPNADQYITWNIDGNKGALTSPVDSLASARYATDTHIAGASKNNQNEIYFIFKGNRENGTYRITYSQIYINGSGFSAFSNSLQAIVKTYGNVGDYITGSYFGNVTDSTSKAMTIRGDFKLKTR